jgi:hypothetical protein|nr:MAG: Prophage endopeptidase tail [Bacteriophage sp.]
MARIQLLVVKDKKTIDMTNLVKSVRWSGRKGSSARTITVAMIDDDGYRHARSGIDVADGNQCVFLVDGKERFRGILMNQNQGDNKQLKFKAYDNGIYLANNKDTFVYKNKTADQVFSDVCSRFGIPTGEVAKCSYKIPEFTKSKTTGQDAVLDALSLDYKATGTRHFISSDKGKLSLLQRKDQVISFVVDGDANLYGYSYTKSIESIKTRVKMISKEGTTLAEKSNSSLEQKVGIFQEIQQPDESLTKAQVKDLVGSVLDTLDDPEETLMLNILGDPDVISGKAILVKIPHLDISRAYYVDSDDHTFEDNMHTMSLTLTTAAEIKKEG